MQILLHRFPSPLELFCPLFFSLLFLTIRGRIKLLKLPALLFKGCRLMSPAVGILLLAWTLGDMLRTDLHSGDYLASLLKSDLSPTFVPFFLFLFSTLIAFATGSSWGTAAIVVPIAIPLIIALSGLPTPLTLDVIPLLDPTLGAVFSGCVAGDHISPISDTTMMSATQHRVPPHRPCANRFPCSTPVIIGVAASYLIWGLFPTQGSFWHCFLAQSSSVLIAIGGLSLRHRIARKLRTNLNWVERVTNARIEQNQRSERIPEENTSDRDRQHEHPKRLKPRIR